MLDGSGSHDGDSGRQKLSFHWTKRSGPDGDAVLSPDDERTEVVFASPGSYSYELALDDGASCDATALATVDVEIGRCVVRFRRGDADGDGIVTVSDAVRILRFLFLLFDPPDCRDAADTDDDGSIDTADGMRILGVLFLGEGGIAPPGALACGADPGEDSLEACAYDTCR